MIPWTTDEVIHRVLKRDVPNSERGTISTLNDLPTWMVDEAREIARESRLAAVRYLRFYVATQHASSAEDFVEDVLLGGDDATTWKVRDCIFVPTEFGRIGALEIAPYLGALAKLDGERWFRIKPSSTAHPSDYTPGIVGVMQRHSRYWHDTPHGITRCPLVSASDVERVMPEQLESRIRRWIAHRLAWWAREYLAQDRAQATGGRIIEAASESQRTPATADVQLAASALAGEARTYGDSPRFPQQAGFLGPDEWYESPMQADTSQVAPDR